MSVRNRLRLHCNQCSHQTWHETRASHVRENLDYIKEADEEFREIETVEILECLGCEHIVVRITCEHEAYGEAEPRFYPPPLSRPLPRWKDKIPEAVRSVLEEVYRALQSDSPRLATMGSRTLLDLVLVDKVGDSGSFQQKLEELEREGFVGGKNREFLAAALETGSAAAHRGLLPTNQQLEHVMGIVENLLEAIYVLPHAAENLRKTTVPRKVKGR